MSVARAGQPLNGIGAAIAKTAKLYGFRVIDDNVLAHARLETRN